jgi:hypothetical protein
MPDVTKFAAAINRFGATGNDVYRDREQVEGIEVTIGGVLANSVRLREKVCLCDPDDNLVVKDFRPG